MSMDFDQIADNEDQLYKDLIEEEAQNEQKPPRKSFAGNNNYDDEWTED